MITSAAQVPPPPVQPPLPIPPLDSPPQAAIVQETAPGTSALEVLPPGANNPSCGIARRRSSLLNNELKYFYSPCCNEDLIRSVFAIFRSINLELFLNDIT
ncbi:hypothetical protein Anas_07950 [Armadillidium nasatum]|uniref:Uncharacterized protein n=1 Tax=Armadillidium nasatum TaxID=96803 RepID=A0A5N5SUT1_9CRUS|nr:hypothetical protein Anas_07950 [Armadillidium nasatum]